jgi:hypothetical protein
VAETKKQPWKYQITHSSRIDLQVFKAAAKKFKRHAEDMGMKPDELFVQLVETLPGK